MASANDAAGITRRPAALYRGILCTGVQLFVLESLFSKGDFLSDKKRIDFAMVNDACDVGLGDFLHES
jgi:hypothetical protein